MLTRIHTNRTSRVCAKAQWCSLPFYVKSGLEQGSCFTICSVLPFSGKVFPVAKKSPNFFISRLFIDSDVRNPTAFVRTNRGLFIVQLDSLFRISARVISRCVPHFYEKRNKQMLTAEVSRLSNLSPAPGLCLPKHNMILC